MNGEDVGLAPVWHNYKDMDMELVRVFNIATIDCVVGQVKVGSHWGIINRTFGLQCAVIHSMWELECKLEDKSD